MPKLTVNFEIKIPFYCKWYCYSLVFFCRAFNTQPDYKKLDAIFNRFAKITVCK